MPIETPTWENSTDVPTWDNSKDETPTWENSREPATATVSTEIPQSQIKLPMRFLPGGMNEPGTQEEKLAEVAGIYQMALSAPNYVVGKVEQFLGVPPAAQEFLQKPLINPQPSPEDVAFRKEHPVVGGIESGIVDLAKSFTSPIGIATFGMSKLPQTAQRAISLAFAGQMAAQAPELATQIIDEYQKPDSAERTQNLARLFTTAGGTTLFAGVAVKHGLSPERPPALPINLERPEFPVTQQNPSLIEEEKLNAGGISKSTRVPEQQVRARMGGQAPLQPGGATPDVQTQPTIAEAKPSLLQRLRTSPLGRSILGPTDIEKQAMAGGVSGSQLGVAEIPEAMLKMTSIGLPPVRKAVEATQKFIEENPEATQLLAPGIGTALGGLAKSKLGRGVERGVEEFALDVPTAPLPGISKGKAALTALGVFGAQYLSDQPEVYQQFKTAVQNGDVESATKIAVQNGLGALLLAFGAKHGINEIRAPLEREVQNASDITSPTRVPEPEVRTRMGEEAPLQPGGATPDVQTQPTIAEAKPPEVAPELTALAPETAKAVQETTPNLGGAITEKSVEQQALSAQNNSLKAFADANGVEFVPGDTPETIFAKVQAKTAELPANAPKEAPVMGQPVKSAGEQIAPSPAETEKPIPEASVVSTTEQQKSKVEPTVESVTPPNEISVGPGARSPSDIPGGTLESQLLDELNRLPSGKKGLGSPTIKIADHVAESIQTGKDALAKWWLGTKAGAEQYRRLLFGPPRTENDFWSTKKDWVANRQVNSGVAREMIKSGKKLVPRPLERRAMGKYAEALMFDDPEAQLKTWAEGSKLSSNREQYEAALKLSDDQKQSVRQAIQYYEAKGRELKDAGMLNSLVEDYAGQHMVDRRNLNSDALNSLRADLIRGTLNTNFKYALRRIFETEFALEQAGGKLKTTDLFDKLANYAKTANDVLADRTAVKAWMAGETSDAIPRPLFATGQGRALIEAQGERPNDALLVNPKVRPRPTVKDKEGNPVDVSGEYVKLDHPAFKKWQWVETTPEGKQIFVQGDIWAHRSIADELKNTMGRSRLYDIPGIDTITRVNAQLKGIKLVGFFHQTKTGIHALTHLVNPFGQPKIDVHSPEVYSAMRAGLQLFETRQAEIFSEGLASSSILQAIPKIGPILKAYQEYLFQDYIPRIKMATYRAALERNLSRYEGKLSRNDLEQITATQVNSAYGELNWKLMGVNPTFQHRLRLALLAPDFQAAQHGFLAQAFTRFGGENRMSLAIMAAALYTGTRIANQILDKDPHWEMDRAFSVIFHGHEYGIRTVASDVKRAFTDLSSFLYHRLSPLASSAVELMTKSNALGQKETGAQALKNVALRAVPIPLTPREDVPFMQAALASTLGYYTKRYSAIADVNKLALDWRKKNDPKFVDEPSQYPQSAFLPMRRHLEQGDMAGAAHEYNVLLKTRTPAQILTAMGQHRAFTSAKFEPRFFASLNDEQKQRYHEALQERKELFRRFLEARNMANHLRASEQTKP